MPLFVVKHQRLLFVRCSKLPLCSAAKHRLIVKVAFNGPDVFNCEIFYFSFLVLDWRTRSVGAKCDSTDRWLQQTLPAALFLHQIRVSRVLDRERFLSETSQLKTRIGWAFAWDLRKAELVFGLINCKSLALSKCVSCVGYPGTSLDDVFLNNFFETEYFRLNFVASTAILTMTF